MEELDAFDLRVKVALILHKVAVCLADEDLSTEDFEDLRSAIVELGFSLRNITSIMMAVDALKN